MPKTYVMMEIEIDATIEIHEIPEKLLPQYWQAFPLMPFSQKVGDNFMRSNPFAVLKVPSALVKGEFNYLIIPHHVDFQKCKIVGLEPFGFDTRFWGG
jgi:RES domain-containing protein